MKWAAMSSIIITATFRTIKKKVSINVIQYYPLTNYKYESVEKELYTHLQSNMINKANDNIKIFIDDLKAFSLIVFNLSLIT